MKMPERDSKHILSGPIGDIVKDLAKVSEADEIGILCTILAGFSGYLGSSTRVKVSNGSMPLSLWFILVDTSGKGRKGMATSLGHKVIEAAWQVWGQESVIEGMPGTGLGLATELSERSDDNGSAAPVLFIEEEFDATINAMKKDTKVGVYLRKAFDGATIAHKTSVTSLKVRNPHFSIIANAQPKNYRAILGGKDSTGGSFNRMMPVMVSQGRKLPVFGGPDPAPVIKRAAKKLRTIASAAREVSEVTVSPRTAKSFEAKHRIALEALTDGNDELAEQCERALAHTVRLAAIYALADGRDQILVKDFDAALALVSYSVATVREIMPETVGDSLPNKIAEAVKASGDEGMTRSELWDAVGRNIKAADVKNAMLTLPQIKTTKVSSGRGRPTEILKWSEMEEVKKERIKSVKAVA